jgi:beta-lactamase regulating signal transducer with metallopeptidase domain
MTAVTFTLLSWLYHATIKGAVVIVLVALLLRLFGSRVDPRFRHLLWLIVLVRLMVPIAPSSSWSLFNLLPGRAAAPVQIRAEGPVRERTTLRTASPGQSKRRTASPPWSRPGRWMFGIWLAGVAILALRTLIASIRINVLVARALRNRQQLPEVQAILDDARAELGIRQTIRVVECPVMKTPALHGLLRPTLLLPPNLATSFSREELRHVILHELWHLRRLDVAVSWLLSAVQTLHWFNPLVWFASSRIKEEREIACDELALSCLEEEERHGYGTTILKLLERFRAATPVPALVGIVNHKLKMKRRLTMIASFRNRTRFSILFLMAAALVGLAGLTDAVGGERVLKQFDPKIHEVFLQLERPVTLDLTNATFSELLATVAAKSGVVITEGPLLATLPVQQARFTVHAENVPAHAVLMETLMPFELAPAPDANGVVIGKSDHIRMRRSDHPESHGTAEREQVMTRRQPVKQDGTAAPVTLEKEVIITNGTPVEADQVMRELEGEAEPGTATERVFVRRSAAAPQFSEDGKLRGELNLQFDANGVKSTGKLTFEITAPPK